uniref:Uncharacterized protein n=1 Tax=Aegilops tauschii TaxID=37682 RepID=N1R347_AEGTA
MSLQEECAQGEWRVKVRSSVPLLTGRSRRTLSVHAGGVIYDDLLATTPLETFQYDEDDRSNMVSFTDEQDSRCMCATQATQRRPNDFLDRISALQATQGRAFSSDARGIPLCETALG